VKGNRVLKKVLWLLSIALISSSALHSVITDLSRDDQKTICAVAICGESRLHDGFTPIEPVLTSASLAVQQAASSSYEDFIVRTSFDEEARSVVVLKKFENAQDVLDLLATVGTHQRVPGARYQYRVRKLTWYYVLHRCVTQRTKHMEIYNYSGARLEMLRALKKPTAQLPQPRYIEQAFDDWVIVKHEDAK